MAWREALTTDLWRECSIPSRTKSFSQSSVAIADDVWHDRIVPALLKSNGNTFNAVNLLWQTSKQLRRAVAKQGRFLTYNLCASELSENEGLLVEVIAKYDASRILRLRVTDVKRKSLAALEALLESCILRNLSALEFPGLRNPLHLAADEGCELVVRLLLETGEDAGAVDEAHQLPLHKASKEAIGHMLLDHGCLACSPDMFHKTPLHCAAGRGFQSLAVRLLALNADVNARGPSRWTPLHFAAAEGHLGVLSVLLDAGAEVNMQDKVGETALHMVARYMFACGDGDRAAAASLLVARGADRRVRDCEQCRPMDAARECGREVHLGRVLAGPHALS